MDSPKRESIVRHIHSIRVNVADLVLEIRANTANIRAQSEQIADVIEQLSDSDISKHAD
jgi:hypothetical protein